MKYTPCDLLTVYLELPVTRAKAPAHRSAGPSGAARGRKAGRLALRERQILFEYDAAFLASGIEISPFQLPLKGGVFVCPDRIFDGLFGVFSDSLPDGWGRLLLDRTVERHGIQRGAMNPLDRLSYVGRNGMGALSYEPDRSNRLHHETTDAPLELDVLAKESAMVLTGANDEVFEELLRLNGSSGGARPKIVAQVNAARSGIRHGYGPLEPGYEHWMIKFSSSHDPPDIGEIEYAYSLMARAAGLEMAETHLFRTRKRAYFGTQRFDRQGDHRLHMHSLAGLLHADHRHPSLDYDTVLRAVAVLTKSVLEVEKAYALACFNVLAHNRDDHSKNFSFLLGADHRWVFSPAFDLTFSFGPAGEHSTMVMGEGRTPGVRQLQTLGRKHEIRHADRILARVQDTVARWKDFAREAGVRPKAIQEIGKRVGR